MEKLFRKRIHEVFSPVNNFVSGKNKAYTWQHINKHTNLKVLSSVLTDWLPCSESVFFIFFLHFAIWAALGDKKGIWWIIITSQSLPMMSNVIPIYFWLFIYIHQSKVNNGPSKFKMTDWSMANDQKQITHELWGCIFLWYSALIHN